MNHHLVLLPILALARAGATSRAWEGFVEAGLDGVAGDAKVLTLKGRLLKDRARAAKGPAQAQLYVQSAKAYADAAAIKPDSYPLINAATMSLFAGQTDHMRMLANEVLALMQTGVGRGETAYWHSATRAEALLLTGDIEAAKASLAEAIGHAPHAWEDHATTLRQFRQISALCNEDHEWLSAHAPPPSLYFSGMMGLAEDDEIARAEVENAVAATNAGFGYGALAAGADILIAEALVAQGAELHVILPVIPSVFKAVSVEPFGGTWVARFDALIESAASVEITDGGAILSMAAVDVAAQVARGRAVDNAARMETTATGLNVVAWGQSKPMNGNYVLALKPSVTVVDQPALPDHAQSLLIGISGTGPNTPGGETICTFADISEVEVVLAKARRENPQATVALSLGVDAVTGSVSDTRRAQIGRMLRSATNGTMIASAEAAMALKARHPAMWVEPLGEIPEAAGAINVYAIVVR